MPQRSRSSPAARPGNAGLKDSIPLGLVKFERHAWPVVLEASHISVLEFVDLEALKAHAVKD